MCADFDGTQILTICAHLMASTMVAIQVLCCTCMKYKSFPILCISGELTVQQASPELLDLIILGSGDVEHCCGLLAFNNAQLSRA